MEAVAQITGVETRSGSNARGQWTMYLFSASDGQQYQTFDKQLGQGLQSHIGGASLRLVYEERSNGNFTNRVVSSFEVAGGSHSAPPQTPQEATGAPQTAVPAKDVQIHRQTAAKVAAELLAYFPPEQQTLPTFRYIVDELVDFFNHGRRDEPQAY